MVNYKINPEGINHVIKDIGHLVKHDLADNLKDVQRTLELAVDHIADQSSPASGAVGLLLASATGEIRGVATATELVLKAAVNATNVYIEADDLMARDADARAGASGEVGIAERHGSKQDDIQRDARVSVDEWMRQHEPRLPGNANGGGSW